MLASPVKGAVTAGEVLVPAQLWVVHQHLGRGLIVPLGRVDHPLLDCRVYCSDRGAIRGVVIRISEIAAPSRTEIDCTRVPSFDG